MSEPIFLKEKRKNVFFFILLFFLTFFFRQNPRVPLSLSFP